jgi:ribosomal protein S18 acetylase RimI-like enzyme
MYLLQAVQRHGLGSRLTRTLVEKFREQGYQSMVLWVAADNVSARKFYETLGGTYISTQQLELGGMILDEVSYGWNNLDTI